ncbi:MAG: deoxyribose-phosphate aldolase [Proteobacteria bacterium]|nr:deoxyribose-phosphate aldolase [Pseudomonadota bacterium]MBU1582411.1 deoxyribose-phosphate aldolase [Pseudomonadota bacterium]MBU2456069.1 deoxyribose-phosphate aldolase [Pseudomonadota bacterium]MBU2630716.1 deoxyribose-phosphate aldolase [Pseudomonadota bacterium]
MKPDILAKYFDHTILNPSATKEDVKQICKEALEYGFFSVCVNPVHVKMVSEQLAGSIVKVCSVVGFPLGAVTSKTKAQETKTAIEDGADEIDMVINIGALKEGDVQSVETDIHAVVTAAKGKIVKVIIETCFLNRDQKINACKIAKKAGAHFVKTSTGFAGGGATCEDVSLMKKTIGNQLKVKASGGIKTLEDALKMIEAGADRIGASAGVSIVKAIV